MAVVSPLIFSNILKKVKHFAELQQYADMVKELNELTERPFDATYFTKDDVAYIKGEIDGAIIFGFVECYESVLESLQTLRAFIDPIFIQNLLFVNRFFKANTDIGTIDQLPDLVKFELHKSIYDNL